MDGWRVVNSTDAPFYKIRDGRLRVRLYLDESVQLMGHLIDMPRGEAQLGHLISLLR